MRRPLIGAGVGKGARLKAYLAVTRDRFFVGVEICRLPDYAAGDHLFGGGGVTTAEPEFRATRGIGDEQ